MFSQMLARPTHVQRAMPTIMQPMRYFGAVAKLQKMELTIRTPYRTIFENFAGFTRLQVRTIGGDMTIGNKSIPRVYLLPPGEMKVQGLQAGEGNNTTSDSGMFMHTGGWLFVHA